MICYIIIAIIFNGECSCELLEESVDFDDFTIENELLSERFYIRTI